MCDSVLVVFPVLCFSILCFISSILASEPNYFDISCLQFLAHLTQRVRWAIAITWCPSSVRKHFNLLLENLWSKWDQTWQECSFACSNQVLLLSSSNMAARGHKNLWLAEMFNDLLRYYMEDGIENCHEWSLQAANQVLLLFGLIENPRWLPAGDII